ncbi:DUF7563 family protein [Halalkalicoccus salilacus]
MPRCNACGEHVTADFYRVYADNENNLHGCPACMSMTKIKDGEATSH